MIFGMLNLEIIRHENLRGLSTSPVRCSYFTLGSPKKVIFNCIIHTYFWLLILSQKKTNCNPLAHPTWKCHRSNLWIAKLFFIWLKVCYVLSNVGGSEKSQLWVVVGGSEKPLVMCGNWNVRQAMSQQVFRVTAFCFNTCFQSFSTLISRIVHDAALKFSPCRNKLLPQASTCPDCPLLL